MFFFVLSL